MSLAPDDHRHGTVHAYLNLNCRCDACKAAWAKRARERLARMVPPPPDDPRHGTENCYKNLKCRCDACKSAWAESHRKYMHSHPEQQHRHADYMRKRRAS